MVASVKDLVVYVDVDDTLVRFAGAKSIPISRSVEHLRALHAAGAQIYCWSTGGADYARKAAESLGIASCFLAFLPKPHIVLDDQRPSEWRRLLHVHPVQVGGRSLEEYVVLLERGR